MCATPCLGWQQLLKGAMLAAGSALATVASACALTDESRAPRETMRVEQQRHAWGATDAAIDGPRLHTDR